MQIQLHEARRGSVCARVVDWTRILSLCALALVPTLVAQEPEPARPETQARVTDAKKDKRVALTVDGKSKVRDKAKNPEKEASKTVEEKLTVRDQSPDETLFKMPTDVHQLPRSLSTFGSERIRTQNFQSVNDALIYTPNMSVNSQRTGGYHFYSRGYRMLPDDTRVDGFSGINAGGRYSASLFAIEEVVLLRGPSSLLYGSTRSPGGMVNLLSKQPQEVAMTQVDLNSGAIAGGSETANDLTGGIDLDSTGQLGESGRVFYRALARFEERAYATEGVRDENRAVNGSLRLKLDPDGRYNLTTMVQWTHFDRPVGGGIRISPSTSLSAADGVSGPIQESDLSPMSINPNSGGGMDESQHLGLTFRGEPTDALRLNAAYRFIGYDTDIDQYTPVISTAAQIALLRNQHQVMRTHSKSITERDTHNIDVNANVEVIPSSGTWRNRTQLGVYSRKSASRATSASGAVPGPQAAIDIYTGETTALHEAYPELVFGAKTETSFWSGYFQNQTSLADEKLIVTLGLGYGQNHPAGGLTQKSDLNPEYAVVYNLSKAVALYGSYATSFSPNDEAAEDAAGRSGVFGPAMGKNKEIGLRYDLPNRKVSTLVSLFRNELDGVLVQSGANDLNPNGNRYYAEGGRRQAEGLELQTEWSPMENWRLTATGAWLDAIYLGGGPASSAATQPIPGTRAEKSPEYSFTLWSQYHMPRGRFEGFSFNLGLIWEDERMGSNGARTPSAPDPLVLPAYTKVDAGVGYRHGAFDWTLHVENLLDELIFINGSVGSSLEVEEPRTVSLRMGYRFN